MPAHFVYRDPNKTVLNQGDILAKTPALVRHLSEFHPYYAQHVEYKYFMVLTQGCDLVLRKGGMCASPYITLAAVRPVEEALRREAARHQQDWQAKANVISLKSKDKIMMFVESLLDNNQSEYFYLHADPQVGIQQNCCAFLQLAVALKSQHYAMCLEAKVCELEEAFQAKLGYTIGQLFNRVGTVEWNEKYTDHPVSTAAKELINQNFVVLKDHQIKEGIAELIKGGKFGTMSPEEVRDYIARFKVRPNKEKLRDRALHLLTSDHNPLDAIQGRLATLISSDAECREKVVQVLVDANIDAAIRPEIADRIVKVLARAMRERCSDANVAEPIKNDIFRKILAKLISDPQIASILSAS